ncbi:MAG TPA: type II toxin-antitoxin system RelE/ParE family toxin [Tepidisphaeraceae bacterium]|nr:type II toxin-antitoxin system RelE/ParE family toxin [Tepidisphaeraceae bacterium]
MASVRITKEAEKQLEGLPAGILPRMYGLIERLNRWPEVSGAKPLKGNRSGQYRLRTGDYRMIVRPVGDVVFVLEVGNRRDIYEE